MSPPSLSGIEIAARRSHALALTGSTRHSMLADFFGRWPGSGAAAPGLGRAILDFHAWEVQSGRLADWGGSPWWAAVNGWLVLDLEAALDGASGPWAAYTQAEPADQQAALWMAHQSSIEDGVRAATPLLPDEDAEERSFIRLVLAVVEAAADLGLPTDSGDLNRQTRATYPFVYPCTAAALAKAQAALKSMGLAPETSL